MIRVVTLKASYHSIVYYHAHFLLGFEKEFSYLYLIGIQAMQIWTSIYFLVDSN